MDHPGRQSWADVDLSQANPASPFTPALAPQRPGHSITGPTHNTDRTNPLAESSCPESPLPAPQAQRALPPQAYGRRQGSTDDDDDMLDEDDSNESQGEDGTPNARKTAAQRLREKKRMKRFRYGTARGNV